MRILLTALGTNNSSSICKYLRQNSENYLVGTDIYPSMYVVASQEVNKFYTVASIYEMDKYFEQLIEIIKKEKIEIVIPIIDEEVLFFAQHHHVFDEMGVKLFVSNSASIEICRDKHKTFELIKKSLPEIYTKTDWLTANIQQFPIFVKPNSGRASIGCQKISDKIELELLLRKNTESYIFQEYVEGDFFTVEFINDLQSGYFGALVRQEFVRNKNGCGVVVQIKQNDVLEKTVEKIAHLINYDGIGNCEFIYQNGKYHLIEINPRISAGIDYSIQAGMNFIQQKLDLSNGRKLKTDKTQIKYEKYFIRRYETYEM